MHMNENWTSLNGKCSAMNCPSSSLAGVLHSIKQYDSSRTIILATDLRFLVQFVGLAKLARVLDMSSHAEFVLPDKASLMVVYMHQAVNRATVSGLYDYFVQNRCYFDTGFLILKDPQFEFIYTKEVQQLKGPNACINAVQSLTFIKKSIAYSRLASDFAKGTSVVTSRTSAAELCELFEQFMAGKIGPICSTVQLPFSAESVQIITLSEELAANLHNLGYQIFILAKTDNMLMLERLGIAISPTCDTLETEPATFPLEQQSGQQESTKNSKLKDIFQHADNVKYHSLVSWRLLVGPEIAAFVVQTMGFQKVTQAQKTILQKIKQRRSVFIYYDAQFQPGNGVTFGILAGALSYCKHQLANCCIVSQRYKWRLIFTALESSSVSGALKRMQLLDKASEVDERFAGLIIQITKTGVRLAFK